MPKLLDIPAGWHGIVQRASDELNIDIEHFDLDEDMGRLRISVADVKLSDTVRKAFILAQFRSLYTCSVCGRPGRHRRPTMGPRVTLCDEHLPSMLADSVVVYDLLRRPWREMSNGRWQYDPITDRLIPKPEGPKS